MPGARPGATGERGSMRRVILPLLLALCAPAAASAEEGESTQPPDPAEAGWERPVFERVRIEHHQRPLTTPRRTFEVSVELPLVYFPPERPILGLIPGARYGIDHDTEVGVLLWPMTFRDGIEFAPPEAFATRRLFATPAFELGATLSLVLPVGGGVFGASAGVPLLVRLAPFLRLDFAARIGALALSPAVADLSLPLALSFQVLRTLRLSLRSGFEAPGLDDAWIPLGADVAWTFTGSQGAFCDLGFTFLLPSMIDLHPDAAIAPERWIAGLSARFYVPAGQDRGDRSPL